MINNLVLYTLVLIIIVPLVSQSTHLNQTYSPPNVVRVSTFWEYCPCGTGLDYLVVFPKKLNQINITI